MDNSNRSLGIRIGLAALGAAIGFALFGSEGKFGPVPAFFVCAWIGFFIGALITWDSGEKTFSTQVVNVTPAVQQRNPSLKEKTCPACISQVPFIASKCKFCGTDLEVQDLGGGRPSISDQINASNMKNQDKAANIKNPEFPNSPAIGDRHTAGSSTWKWEGNKWNLE